MTSRYVPGSHCWALSALFRDESYGSELRRGDVLVQTHNEMKQLQESAWASHSGVFVRSVVSVMHTSRVPLRREGCETFLAALARSS